MLIAPKSQNIQIPLLPFFFVHGVFQHVWNVCQARSAFLHSAVSPAVAEPWGRVAWYLNQEIKEGPRSVAKSQTSRVILNALSDIIFWGPQQQQQYVWTRFLNTLLVPLESFTDSPSACTCFVCNLKAAIAQLSQ